MNTVKRFKDLGLEFHKDDIYSSESKYAPLVKLPNVNNVERLDYRTVAEFAWRENTGEEPEFRGVIEVEFRDGEKLSEYTTKALRWHEMDYRTITKWRPLLTQSKQQEKPIYTQEMADAKALVPVGADYRSGNIVYSCVALHIDGGIIGCNGQGSLYHHRHESIDISPLKTRRDIEIDLIKEVALIVIGGMLNAASERDIEEIYKMGYRVTKPGE